MKPYAHHPYAAIFPFRDGVSLIELSDSIKEHGQYEEIVLLDRQVLEGRRRQAAAIRAGITPRYRDFGSRTGDGDDPLEFAFQVNFQRRDMSEAERVVAAVAYANLKKGDNQHAAKGNEVGANEPTSPASQAEAARKFGVPVSQIKRAKVVIEKGVPELVAAMKDETVSVSDAAAIASEPPDVQRKAVATVQAKGGTLQAAVAGTKPEAGENAQMVGRDLEVLIKRAARIDTSHEDRRELAVKGLTGALALVQRL